MAYEIKGDAAVGRDFSAGRRSSASLALNAPDWAPTTDYLEGDIVAVGDDMYRRRSAGTST